MEGVVVAATRGDDPENRDTRRDQSETVAVTTPTAKKRAGGTAKAL